MIRWRTSFLMRNDGVNAKSTLIRVYERNFSSQCKKKCVCSFSFVALIFNSHKLTEQKIDIVMCCFSSDPENKISVESITKYQNNNEQCVSQEFMLSIFICYTN